MAPLYRLTRNGQRSLGMGDLLLALTATLWRAEHANTSAGLVIAASLPTGSKEHGLGMGHAMLMPGVWGVWIANRLTLQGQLSYGRALASGSAHHAGGPAPLVNPMNASEIEGALTAAWELSNRVELRARMAGAAPLADPQGEFRAIAGLGAAWRMGDVTLGFEGQFPLTGSPFTARALAMTSVLF